MEENKKSASTGGYIFWVAIIGIIVLFVPISFHQKRDIDLTRSYSNTENDDANIYDTAIDAGEPLLDAANRQVIDDSIKQYQIVERSGNVIDMCVHAGMVKAAYLQANDEGGYKNWSDITSKVCKAAGMPGM